ncbi:MAG: hypothetical protein IJM27_03485 [Eubacterium sp.]|nr:hypothetical protein [Eubacterium sp.]
MYRTLFFAGLILAVAFLIATIVLFFVLKIPKALGVVTGRTQKRAIEEIRAGGLEAVSKRKSRGSRNIHVREVEMETGSLSKGTTGNPATDTAQTAIKDAATAAAKAAEQAKSQSTSASLGTASGSRSRKDRSKAFEETEILDFTGSLEDDTIHPESEMETDVLGGDSAAEEETDLLSSDGGTVGAKASAAVNAAAKRAKDDAYREEETDVLSYGGNRTAADEGDETDVLMSGTSVPQDEEIVGRYSAEETAVLRSIHVSADEPKTDSKKIVTLYSETIVHTEESL